MSRSNLNELAHIPFHRSRSEQAGTACSSTPNAGRRTRSSGSQSSVSIASRRPTHHVDILVCGPIVTTHTALACDLSHHSEGHRVRACKRSARAFRTVVKLTEHQHKSAAAEVVGTNLIHKPEWNW